MDGFILCVGLHREGSVPAACSAGLFIGKVFSFSFVNDIQKKFWKKDLLVEVTHIFFLFLYK